ncbi:MAG: hypothetical protein H0X64_03625, partial [Gemmatimonadaceae bacterium]|nr:hypothetical protein [Gemmatimonadaceae bacterium]
MFGGNHTTFRSVIRCAIAIVMFTLMGTAAVAQSLPEDAAEALQRAQRAAAQAQLAYTEHFPDLPLW